MVAAIVAAAPGWVFPSHKGGPVRPGTISHWLGDALPAPWTAHTLRHAFATDLYARTNDLLLVSEQLGHTSVATTERYVKVRAAAAAAHVTAMRVA